MLLVVAVPQTAQKPWRACQLSKRPGLRQRAEMLGRQNGGGGECPERHRRHLRLVDRRVLGKRRSEPRGIVAPAEQHRLCQVGAEGLGFIRREQRIVAGPDQRRIAAEKIEPCRRVGQRMDK